MVSSMASRPLRDGCPVTGRTRATLLATIAAIATVGLVVGLGATTASAHGTSVATPERLAVQCASPPPAGTVSADIPWPQQRYDLDALGRITQGAGVTVAVVDSGVDAATPQLAGAVQAGGDTLDPTGDGRVDCLGHGTAVASIIAARPLPGAGLRGLAPAADILAVRVSQRIDTGNAIVGSGDLQDLVAGIRAAASHNPRPGVINLSISTGTDDSRLRAAVQEALDADIVVVAAVGNGHDQGDPRPYPASYDGVVGVGAIGPSGERVASSQVGSYVDIVAPGDAVVGAAPRGGHLSYQGTSFATPFVAATAALIRARWPRLDRGEVGRRLLATADPAAGGRPSPDYGYGVVNPMRALTEVLPAAVAVPTVSATPVIEPGLAIPGRRHRPSPFALTAATILLLAAAAVAGIAAATPAGRRRGWRPGRITPPPAGQ